MWDEWCADDLYAYDAGTHPAVADNPYAYYATTEPAPTDDGGSSLDDVWGLAVTAIAGIIAYEGVRRLLGRNKQQEHASAASATSGSPPLPSAQGDDVRVPASQAATAATGEREPRHEPTTPEPAEQPIDGSAGLVDDLIALYDLEPNEALKRRIVRSLAKVGIRIDDVTGIEFDSERHDVMGTIAAEPGVAPGTVVDVVRPGFATDDGRVLRPTEVAVATDADGAW